MLQSESQFALHALGQFHDDLLSSAGTTLIKFEEIFTSGIKLTINLADAEQLGFARKLLRPLAPELHAFASSMLAALDSDEAALFANNLADATVHWPTDFWFEAPGVSQRAAKLRRWHPELARIVVQTADRCGALRELLSRLQVHDPAATWLLAAHKRLTDAFGVQDNFSTGQHFR